MPWSISTKWIAEEVESVFAKQESAAFVNGDGVKKPKGFLTAPTIANGSWTWGNLGVIGTGAAGAFPMPTHPTCSSTSSTR